MKGRPAATGIATGQGIPRRQQNIPSPTDPPNQAVAPMTRRATLAEPIIIAEWWKNRRGELIRVRVSTYEGHNLVDLRSWYSGDDGRLKLGKGLAVAFDTCRSWLTC